MADVFVSYARSTEACAHALAEIIEHNGYSVWYDARLPAHRVYSDVIREEIDAAKAVLIIWSKEAVRSAWVRSEAERGRHNGTLIQLRIEDCVLPMPFDQIQCPLVRDWSRTSAPQLSTILESLSELLKGDGSEHRLELPAPNTARVTRPEEAQLLFEAAYKALQSGDPKEHAQAIPLLIEATGVAPEDAEAWGLLAVLYAARRLEVTPAERQAIIARAKSAIKTALDLDETEVRARCADLILITFYRNWDRKEREAKALLDRVPDQPLALFSLASALGHVGRWQEAAETVAKISRTKFLLPAVEEFMVYAFWSAGNIVQAELVGERAARRFPAHAGLWEARVAVLMLSGRTGDALDLIENKRARPPQYASIKTDSLRLTAKALAGTAPPAAAINKNLEVLSGGAKDPIAAALDPLTVAQRCAALGELDECFSLLDGYYFGRGPWAHVAPLGEDEDRLTWPLFTPAMAAAWSDERFNALASTIGLNAYWNEAGTQPDYRRA